MASRVPLLGLLAAKCPLIRHSLNRQTFSTLKNTNEFQGRIPSTRELWSTTILQTQPISTNKDEINKPLKQNMIESDKSLSEIISNLGEKSDEDEALKMLKMKLEKLGQLNVSDLERAVSSLTQRTDALTDHDCLKLLNFTLRMVQNEYRSCASVVESIWKLCTERSNARLTLEHIDIFLHATLLTGSSCTSKEIFNLLEDHQLEPSRDILELLILVLGHCGDLAGVTSILTAMKQRNIPITETVFSAFIMAHGADGDSKGIESILSSMRSVQMTPTNITYAAMIHAYGVSGQISEMKQVVAQMKQAGVALTHNQLASLLLSLVKAGIHFENMDCIVELIEESGRGFNLSRVVLQIIHSGHVHEAIHLLPMIPRIRDNNHLYSNAAIYIQEVVHTQVEPSLVVEICKQLQSKEINRFAFHVALEYALRMKNEKLAWALMKAIKESGSLLREHYFWPLLHMSAVANEPTKLLECVREMITLGETPGLETLKDYIIPGLTVNHPDLTMKMLKHAGLTVTTAATPLLIVLIKNNLFKQAFEFVKKTKVSFSLRDITTTLASAWSANPRTIISLLALLIEKSKENVVENELDADDWGGQFLLDLGTSRAGLNAERIRPLFKELKKNGIGISENSADLLMTRSNRYIQEAIRNNINIILNPKMGHPPKEQEYNILPHPKSMTSEELDGHMTELQSKGLNVRGTLRRLLLHHASKNDTESVLNLMKKATDDGIKLSAGMMASILMAYVNNGNANAALDIYASLQEEHPSFSLDSFKVIDLCTLLIQDGRSEEGIVTLRKYLKNINQAGDGDTTQIRRNCRNLLMAAATTGDYELTHQLFHMLHSKGLVKAENLSLGALVKCRLNSGSLLAAVQEAEMIYENYKCLPMRIEILILLIHHSKCQSEKMNLSDLFRRGEDSSNPASDLLEQMLNIIVRCRGLSQARHDLLFACLEAGQPLDARKVMQNLGKELDLKLVYRQLERYSKTEQDNTLTHFLTASKGNIAVNRQKICDSLLNIYYVQSAGDKALSLWTMMQEEDLTPSETFLSTLASLLAANNMKIPFQIQ
nr:leucine-rich PPR motif-containing protein, mitochondrial-like isoform X1 [Procambarus clarkii]